MANLVVISGHPDPGSPTLELAAALGERLAEGGSYVTVDVAALGPGLLAPGDGPTGEALLSVQDATTLVVATPVRHGSYTGVLKVLPDQLPANALAGVVAVPVVTADTQTEADAADAALARLLSELGADILDFGLTAVGPELTDLQATATVYAAWIAG